MEKIMNATHTGDLESSPLRLGGVTHGCGLPEDQPDWLSEDNESRFAVEFSYSREEAFAQTLDQHGVSWQYKPRTFAVEWDDEGNFVDSFTPDFYIALLDLYVEVMGPYHHEAGAKARKVRLLRQQQPGLKIELLCGTPASFVQRIFLRRLY
jgi:hypothetical protein